MRPEERPIAPHGYERHPRHAVVAGAWTDGGRTVAVHGALLPRAVAAVRAPQGWTPLYYQSDQFLGLLLHSEQPGILLSGGRGTGLRTELYACEGGIILPGAPPPLPWEAGEREVWPFVFLLTVDLAVGSMASWRSWAEDEKLDVERLHKHTQEGPWGSW